MTNDMVVGRRAHLLHEGRAQAGKVLPNGRAIADYSLDKMPNRDAVMILAVMAQIEANGLCQLAVSAFKRATAATWRVCIGCFG
jgi:hypothetical protein